MENPRMRHTALPSIAILLAAALVSGCHPADRADGTALHATGVSPPVERRDGWLILRLSGTPYQIGRGHGSALAPEIDDAIKENILAENHSDGDEPAMTWAWARAACREVIE